MDLSAPDIAVSAHREGVSAIACASRPPFVVSGSSQGSLAVWDVLTAKAVSSAYAVHTGFANGVLAAFYLSDDVFATHGRDQRVCLWDVRAPGFGQNPAAVVAAPSFTFCRASPVRSASSPAHPPTDAILVPTAQDSIALFDLRAMRSSLTITSPTTPTGVFGNILSAVALPSHSFCSAPPPTVPSSDDDEEVAPRTVTGQVVVGFEGGAVGLFDACDGTPIWVRRIFPQPVLALTAAHLTSSAPGGGVCVWAGGASLQPSDIEKVATDAPRPSAAVALWQEEEEGGGDAEDGSGPDGQCLASAPGGGACPSAGGVAVSFGETVGMPPPSGPTSSLSAAVEAAGLTARARAAVARCDALRCQGPLSRPVVGSCLPPGVVGGRVGVSDISFTPAYGGLLSFVTWEGRACVVRVGDLATQHRAAVAGVTGRGRICDATMLAYKGVSVEAAVGKTRSVAGGPPLEACDVPLDVPAQLPHMAVEEVLGVRSFSGTANCVVFGWCDGGGSDEREEESLLAGGAGDSDGYEDDYEVGDLPSKRSEAAQGTANVGGVVAGGGSDGTIALWRLSRFG